MTGVQTCALPILAHAYGSAITLGIIAAYAVGKPIGITGTAGLVTKLSRGRIRPPVGWVSVLGGGAVAGIAYARCTPQTYAQKLVMRARKTSCLHPGATFTDD